MSKRGMAYFLGDSDPLTNHVLPINAMQYSSYSGQLFSGGRDGTVKIWQPTERIDTAINSPNPFVFNEQHFETSQSSLSNGGGNSGGNGPQAATQNDMSESILKLETSISSNPLCYEDTKYSGYTINQSFDLHFDWINDLKLINNDRDLVTCSSDLSIKMVNLHSANVEEGAGLVHRFPSIHTDYIKKLSVFKFENSIVSGGLDGKAVVWDLNALKPINSLISEEETSGVPNSIYALANNDTNIITTGGSSNIINLYDKRVKGGKFMGKLIGHQDQIRCLLMNDRFVLSGSSDTSIKLWDLRNWKVYKNFEMHNDPVWCLTNGVDSSPGLLNQAASHDDFRVFYSGDRAGNIIKTDMSHFSDFDIDDYEEDALFNRTLDQKLGVATLVAKSNSPIISLCVESNVRSSNGSSEEPTIFSSNYTTLDRYRVPDVNEISKYQYLRTTMDLFTMDGLLDVDEAEASIADQQSDFYDIVSHLSMDTNTLDIQLSLSGVTNNNNTNAGTTTGPPFPVPVVDTDIKYTSMFYNIDTGGPSWEFVNAYKECLEENEGQNIQQQQQQQIQTSDSTATIDRTPVEILLNPLPPDQVSLIPFNIRAMNQFPIINKPMIAKRMLNNKRHILTMLMDGVIILWDILMCKELKTWSNDSKRKHEETITKDFIEERTKQMDKIYHQLQTQDTLRNWCDVEIKAGKLMVILRESCLKNLVEIYYDEMIKDYPMLSVGSDMAKVDADDRFAIIKIILNSFFHEYLAAELDFDIRLREELLLRRKTVKGSSDSLSKLNSKEIEGESSSLRKKLTFSKSKGQSSSHQDVVSAKSSVCDIPLSGSDVTFLNEIITANVSGTNSNEVNIHNSILEHKQKYWEKLKSNNKALDTLLMLYSNDPMFIASKQEKGSEGNNNYCPVIPSKYLPSNLVLTVFEDDPTLGNFREVCSYTLNELHNITHEIIRSLRHNLPSWLVQPLLYDKYPPIEVTRISFQLLECNYLQLAPNKTIQGKSQKKIKRLPQIDGSLKLTSHSMLRVLKILGYVCEKFESKTSEMRDKKLAYEWLALECKGQELPPTMTLQTIKTIIWKSGTDLELRYRRKFD
ncbi:uncharacterized protein KQ657_005250 [Scheffersomyces spartinae]|uniref:Uncharacterized protein n=1 Tax=Scheffersomyces spartinae TaxID=45513 RepID=A0A9P7VA15_9ASCO|nr:uncharacterized protein KQ657_005250 [Scheffersomyces spartinae]KAG7194047.1 hypothetical protein KQ657_005250 [Scheffersomyces spartinae]